MIYVAVLLAWEALILCVLVAYRIPYYLRVVAETGRWYDYDAVTRLASFLLLAPPAPLILLSDLVPSRRRLLLALCVPFQAAAVSLVSAALLARGFDVLLAVLLYIGVSALYWCAKALARLQVPAPKQ